MYSVLLVICSVSIWPTSVPSQSPSTSTRPSMSAVPSSQVSFGCDVHFSCPKNWPDMRRSLLFIAFYEPKCIDLADCFAIVFSVRKAERRAFVSAERPAYICAFSGAQQSAIVSSIDCANRLTIHCSIISTDDAAIWRA